MAHVRLRQVASASLPSIVRKIARHPLLSMLVVSLIVLLGVVSKFHYAISAAMRSHQRTVHVLLNAIPDTTSTLLALAGLTFLIPDLARKLESRKIVHHLIVASFCLFAFISIVLNAINREEQDRNQDLQRKANVALRGSIADVQRALSFKAVKMTEPERREHLMTTLRDEYIAMHDQVDPELIAGIKMPPDVWLNQRLKQLGENWLVASTGKAPLTTKEVIVQSASKANNGQSLLQQAKAWQDQLCGFEKSWLLEHEGWQARVRDSDKQFGIPQTSTDKELEFRIEMLEVNKRAIYFRDYAEHSNQLRMELIGQVPGAENTSVDYLTFLSFTAANGRLLMTLGQMQDICRDFSGLVEAYEEKLSRK